MKLLFFTLFFCALSSSFSFGQWSQIETLKGGDIITDIIEFKNDIYISTSSNSLFRSTDQGITWTQPELPQRWRIADMTVYKDSLFAVVSGALFKSANGIDWTQHPLTSTFVNQIITVEDTLYLANFYGISKSGDGGSSWIDINNSETSQGINSIAKNGNVLFAGGKSGKLYKSVNGGSTWETITINTQYDVNQIFASNGSIFINITEKILKSDDNGLNWVSVSPTTRNDYIYLNNSIGFIASANTVYKTVDNGISWSSTSYKLPSTSANAIYFNENYVFTGFWGMGISRNTINLDEEWNTSNEGLMLMVIHRIRTSDNNIYVGTEFNFVHSSSDEGLTWKAEKNYYNGYNGNARSMATINDNILIGQGGGGIQRKKGTDGNWERANEGLGTLLIDDLSANKNYVFAAVSDSGIYRSENYGTTWIKKSNGINSNVRNLYATDNKVFAGTWDGIYMSENDGESWEDISNALPDRSINKICFFDTCLFVATQNNGLYRSYDLGLHWTQIYPESVFEIEVYNKNLFIGSWNGILRISKNLGDTWMNTDVDKSIGIVESIGFSENYVFTGGNQPGRGLWKRPLHQLLPPSYRFYSTLSDTSFKGKDKLFFRSDMALKNAAGDDLTISMLADLVKIYDSNSNEINYTATIDNSLKIISITIETPVIGEKYRIVVAPLKNESGLIKEETTSQAFTYLQNNLPTLSNIELSGIEKKEVYISSNDFINAFTDIDNDQITMVKLIQLPENGNISLNGKEINVGDEIPFNEIDSIVYVSINDFEGVDQIVWNASDGYDYSENNRFKGNGATGWSFYEFYL